MFKLFNRPQKEKKSVVGVRTELVHDLTVFQYGTVFINGVRYSVRANTPKTEMCKGTVVEVLEESCEHGSTILTVKKV